MSTTNTSAIKLNKPAFADRDWHLTLNQNADLLDGQSALAGLCVTTLESPSASLNLTIAPGKFRKPDGTIGSYAGTPGLLLPAASTTYLYLDPSGNLLTSTSGFPQTACVPLAMAVTGASTITSVTDARIQCAVTGAGAAPFLPLAGGAMNDGANIAVGTAAGTRIGTSSTQKLGFWNSAPVVQPGPYTQTYTTADRTLSSYASSVQSTVFSGVATGQSGTPYAQVADLNSLRLAYENLRAFSEDVGQALNALIDDLQAMGLVR